MRNFFYILRVIIVTVYVSRGKAVLFNFLILTTTIYVNPKSHMLTMVSIDVRPKLYYYISLTPVKKEKQTTKTFEL